MFIERSPVRRAGFSSRLFSAAVSGKSLTNHHQNSPIVRITRTPNERNSEPKNLRNQST